LPPAARDGSVGRVTILEEAARRLAARGMRLEATDAARDLLSGPGAGHLAVAELEGGLSLLLAGGEVGAGDTVEVDVRDGRLVCTLGRRSGGGRAGGAEGDRPLPPAGGGPL
jgi:hypothetical protein